MRISVALCTYNGALFLRDQLESIAAQTRRPDELVVCDDCSTDSTRQIIEEFIQQAPFPVRHYCNRANLGSSKNFEQAIGLCEGDIIALADQDDYWYNHKLERIESVFDPLPNVGLLFSDADVVDSRRKPLGYRLWQSSRFDQKQQTQMRVNALSVLLRHPVVTGAAMAFRIQHRNLLLPIGAGWVHDEWIALLIAAVSRIEIIEEPLMQYRKHDANQLGVEGVSIGERLHAGLSTDPKIYLDRFQQFEVLRQHIEKHMPNQSALVAEIDGKMTHFQVRGTLPDAHVRRILPIAKELMAGRYSRYSASALNALRDLALKH